MARIFEELPAPPRPVLTEDQKYLRRKRFALVLNWFVLGYSILHKFLLPLFVDLEHSSSFAPIDWWWVYHLALAFLLLRDNWDDLILRASLVFGIGGAACQILVSFLERDWHSVSLWVTSASTLWVVLFLLSRTRWRFPPEWGIGKYALKASALALGFFVQFALFGFSLGVEKAVSDAARQAVPAVRLPVLADPNACGVAGFSIPLENGSLKLPPLNTFRDVPVEDCGFPAALARFDAAGTLTVRNATSGYLNVKLYALLDGRWRPIQNMPLPPGLEHDLPPEFLRSYPVVLMASDADPKKGILLLVSDPAALSSLISPNPSKRVLQVDRTGLALF